MRKARKSRKSKMTSTRKPLGDQSLIMGGNIYCINQMKNDSPYWGGHTCDSHTKHSDNVVKWVCSSCVANAMPMPVLQQATPKIDPNTGEKRKRGRPKGSKTKSTEHNSQQG